jgi:hypothetical protein
MTDEIPSEPRVAIDLDSTLANTLAVACELIGYEYQPTFSSLEDPIDQFGEAKFLNAVWHAWTIRPERISPTEPLISLTTEHLHALSEQLDVVTAHPQREILGLDENKRQWLHDHDIAFDEYRSVAGDKHELGYDVIIDNNPNLPERAAETDVTVLLYDQPHNRDADGEYTRIESLSGAIPMISDGETVTPDQLSGETV